MPAISILNIRANVDPFLRLTHDNHDVVESLLHPSGLIFDGDGVESFILTLHVFEQNFEIISVQHKRRMGARHILFNDKGATVFKIIGVFLKQ